MKTQETNLKKRIDALEKENKILKGLAGKDVVAYEEEGRDASYEVSYRLGLMDDIIELIYSYQQHPKKDEGNKKVAKAWEDLKSERNLMNEAFDKLSKLMDPMIKNPKTDWRLFW